MAARSDVLGLRMRRSRQSRWRRRALRHSPRPVPVAQRAASSAPSVGRANLAIEPELAERERQLREREKQIADRERDLAEQRRVLAEQHRHPQGGSSRGAAGPAGVALAESPAHADALAAAPRSARAPFLPLRAQRR